MGRVPFTHLNSQLKKKKILPVLPAELQYFGTNKYCSPYSLLPLGRAGLCRSYKLKELNDCFHTDLSLHVEKGGRNFVSNRNQ